MTDTISTDGASPERGGSPAAGTSDRSDSFAPTLPPTTSVARPARATMARPALVVPPTDVRRSSDTVPAPPAHTPPEPARIAGEGTYAVHRATSERLRAARRPSRPPRPWPARVMRWLLLIVLTAIVVGAVVAAVVAVRSVLRADDLPASSGEPPTFGTVSVRFEEQGPGTDVEGTITADADLEHYRLWTRDGSTTIEIVHNPSGTYADDGTGWERVVETAELQRAAAAFATIPMVDDVLTPAARPFSEVVRREESEVSGRDVDRYEIDVHVRRFEQRDPIGYAEWRSIWEPDDDDAPVRRISLWVDDDGIVWRNGKVIDGEPWSRFELVSFESTPYVAETPDVVADGAPAEAPATELDELLPTRAAGCQLGRSVVRMHIDQYTEDHGAPPASESDLVEAGLIEQELADWDVVDGRAVPDPEGECALRSR